VFVGTNGKDRFGNLLHNMLDVLDPSQKSTLGCQIEDIGNRQRNTSEKGPEKRSSSSSSCVGGK